MKKRIPVTVPVCMLLAALAAPWAAVTFLPADAGMAAVLLLFFGADPVVSILTGATAGRRPDRLWSLPLLFPLLCLLGAWIFFGGGSFDPAFLLYAAVYLILGLAAMLLSCTIRRKAGR